MSQAATLAGAAPGLVVDWHSISWNKVYRAVRRLPARIVKAAREGKWHKVKALVYLLTHSFSGRALAILRVISNSGAKTAGVDGVIWNTPEAKSDAFNALRWHGYQPQPLRRVYITPAAKLVTRFMTRILNGRVTEVTHHALRQTLELLQQALHVDTQLLHTRGESP